MFQINYISVLVSITLRIGDRYITSGNLQGLVLEFNHVHINMHTYSTKTHTHTTVLPFQRQ